MTSEPSEPREYIRFAFYRFADTWHALDDATRARALDELAAVLTAPVAPWQLCYSLAGLRADVDFAVWLKTTEGTGPLQEFEHRIRATACGPHLVLAYNFISMTKPSPYARGVSDAEREALRAYPDGAPYVFVYPMVKTRAWYTLPPVGWNQTSRLPSLGVTPTSGGTTPPPADPNAARVTRKDVA